VRASERSEALCLFQFFNLTTEFRGATVVKLLARRRKQPVLFDDYVLLHHILELRNSFQPTGVVDGRF